MRKSTLCKCGTKSTFRSKKNFEFFENQIMREKQEDFGSSDILVDRAPQRVTAFSWHEMILEWLLLLRCIIISNPSTSNSVYDFLLILQSEM